MSATVDDPANPGKDLRTTSRLTGVAAKQALVDLAIYELLQFSRRPAEPDHPPLGDESRFDQQELGEPSRRPSGIDQMWN